MSGRLDGRVALITGGARGIGRATAELFVSEGAQVVIADVRADDGEAAAKELGGATRFVELDVADEAAWDRAIGEIDAEEGRLDVLINNAGIVAFSPLAAMTTEEFMRVVSVNQLGVFLGMRSVAPLMTRVNRGSIVNISSIDGLAGSPLAGAYVATKFAVRGMTKVAALELAAVGIRVNSIHPGVIPTPIVDDVAPGFDFAGLFQSSIPMQRLGRPEEIAALALFLASDESSYCTGSEFVADGGVTAGLMFNNIDFP